MNFEEGRHAAGRFARHRPNARGFARQGQGAGRRCQAVILQARSATAPAGPHRHAGRRLGKGVVLKTSAADGDNGLHAHPNEDHTFVVLQGEAIFYGPNDEEKVIGKNEGVLLPHGTFYWFKAKGDEPLVMIRIGSAAFDGVDRHGRIHPDGSEMRGDSVENKQVPLIMSDDWFR
jgi:mannose-6-phosphate isomerase-like protein (cupin superfamily)